MNRQSPTDPGPAPWACVAHTGRRDSGGLGDVAGGSALSNPQRFGRGKEVTLVAPHFECGYPQALSLGAPHVGCGHAYAMSGGRGAPGSLRAAGPGAAVAGGVL